MTQRKTMDTKLTETRQRQNGTMETFLALKQQKDRRMKVSADNTTQQVLVEERGPAGRRADMSSSALWGFCWRDGLDVGTLW